MNKMKWALGGFALGVIVTAGALYLGARVVVKHPEILSCRKSIELPIDEMVLLKSPRGTALIDFTTYGRDGATSSYRWRFRPINGAETHGTGTVFEKYDRLPGPKGALLIDRGGEMNVVAGNVTMEWSYASTDEGWLYYSSRGTTVTLLPDSDFDKPTLK